MAILRCPYCGKKIKEDQHTCRHCGKTFDKPHIDDVDTAFQGIGNTIVKLIGIVILWFIILIIVGFIGNIFNFPKYSPVLFIFSIVLTAVIVIVIKLKK